MIMKQSKEKFDFKAFGQAIKAARKTKGLSRNQLADKLNIAPRYIASIENSRDLTIMTTTAKGIQEANSKETGE